MRHRRTVGLLGLALLAATAAADPERGPKPEHDGYALYQRFCGSCHGVRADGKGPRAPALEKPPTDLTRLSAERGQPVRLAELTHVIDGRRTVRAHGEGPMPVWGEELASDVTDPEMRERARIRMIQSLAEYLLSIQVSADEDAEDDPSR